MSDVVADVEMSRVDMERALQALEVIGTALGAMASAMIARQVTERARYEKDYPVKKEVADATITHLQSDEERLRQSQGATGESDEQWIGRREQKFEAAKVAKIRRRETSGS